ncbi:bifunctional [glutamine synthetase] adenylyltransferase/[glutamine synthetase]-adenylyl-L-tyrosine phosphorylase [Actinomycetospora sp. TBRC 11914]|uniref:bifunctional [glutamine synthetase] adenylyltransferase/[glutamine synthetase]-adenylyl-L-tyrosine phosphorylase n=1 Tax=Actinomycetospora sp. TBRC 11914 TaxID=2729387 RepID=UPI00145F2E2D|nr:bifunctional [glutamine synthetase] adenylyltransferase/[glutamine synthetase]-adenylyl-L-tyrosine phosphorylase [Actinomycetospora sp. TBRC 11914]NMO90487.1 bifunctional [glutamine synthetase] adenylyltransferase/[glutamine synthetase]-adenylyl-L-tyrosine phosphorylase [Actinomycetospora sp. TBRC 11914]
MTAPRAARDRRPARAPARLGLTDADAGPRLAALGWWDGDDAVPGAALVVWALARAADPDLALLAVERLREAAGEEGWAELDAALREDQGLRGRLFGVLGGSTALGDHLVAQPERWRLLRTVLAPGRVHDASRMPSAADRRRTHLDAVGAKADEETPVAAVTGPAAVEQLRLAWRDDVLLLAAADLQSVCEPELPFWPVDVISGQLADVAAAGLEAALAVARAEVGAERAGEARLAVIGMGKCGGRELNYVSDIDVIFVADGSVDSATRVAATMMRVATEAFLEVDANLRPEGRSGQLVRTLEGHETYYRRWARTWEFQALLKARPVAGDLALGQEYCDALAPMVWQAAERDDFVADVRAMRRRVEDHIRHDVADRELKLGRGGLRDVEFAVQLLQLVHGRGDETLRGQNTLETLAALGEGGYVGRDDAANLAASYRFLRMLEHRVQLQKLRRTHLFPSDEDTTSLRWLARAAKLRPDGRHDAVGVLQAELARNTVRVRRLHEKLFYRPLLESVARVPGEQLVLTESSATKRLAALGWSSPAGALKHVAALTSGTTRASRIQRALMPVLLDRLGTTADPDHGLLAYRKVSEALADTPWFLALLRDEGLAADRLCYVLGTSRWVAEMMPRSPEVLRLLGGDGPSADLVARDPDEVAGSLRAAVARHTDPRSAGNVARSLRRVELLRVACADLLGLTDVPHVCAALSSVWVAVLQAALDAAERERAGDAIDGSGTRPATIAIIGMGRLGGAELGYGSDADVVVVCEPAEGVSDQDATNYARAVVESVTAALGAPSPDPPLEVDTKLRPEGRSGPLVRTLSSYADYLRRWAATWERQALLRARPVAGDAALGKRFEEMIAPYRYPAEGLPEEQAMEIRRMKARVDAERLPRGADRALHTKLGTGGLADVEWTVQLLQLQHAGRLPSLRTTSTLEALRALAEAGLLSDDDAEALAAGWTTATRARGVATLVRGKPTDQLPRSGRELAAIASALGYPEDDPGACIDEYRRVTRHARAVVDAAFSAV